MQDDIFSTVLISIRKRYLNPESQGPMKTQRQSETLVNTFQKKIYRLLFFVYQQDGYGTQHLQEILLAAKSSNALQAAFMSAVQQS